MSSIISVQLDAVAALAAELTALAAELDDEAALCRSTASSFASALPGENGWAAADAATAWSGLTAVVAERGRAVAATLAAAVDSYRAIDTALAGRIEPRRAGDMAMPR
jgi:hypothetical protein